MDPFITILAVTALLILLAVTSLRFLVDSRDIVTTQERDVGLDGIAVGLPAVTPSSRVSRR